MTHSTIQEHWKSDGKVAVWGMDAAWSYYLQLLFDPQHEETYRLTCAPNKDSDQTAHPRSLIRVFVVRMKKLCILGYPNAPSEDSDQTARMRRLIWIFALRTNPKVRFLMLLLILWAHMTAVLKTARLIHTNSKFNSLMPNGLFYNNSLDSSISNLSGLRGGGWGGWGGVLSGKGYYW